MCGIFGSVNANMDADRSLTLLNHRGPDSRGVERFTVRGQQVLFGQTRLAILDLSSAGQQPMTSADDRWVVTYNGETYNHLDLRKQLSADFRGHSDTETLVEHLAAFGMAKTLSALNGMFAFAALDREEGKLYLIRDPFGIKPLYYRVTADGGLLFGSEIRVIDEASDSALQIDPEALQTFLTLRFVPSPSTLWRDVKRLPPGHLLEIDLESGEQHLECYIEPTTERFDGSVDEAVERYHDLLKAGIERQMLSDVPVGILLSSGVDSAVVAALAKELGASLPCYTVGFEDAADESEIPGARETCEALDLPFTPVVSRPDDVMTVIDDVVGSLEEPIVSTAPLVLWQLIQRTRSDVTVALTGQGSDEPWGGYTRYYNEVVRSHLPWPEGLAKVQRARPLWRRLPESVDRAMRSLPISDNASRFREAYALFTAEERRSLTGDDGDGTALSSLNYWLDWNSPSMSSNVEQMMRVDTRTCLGDDWLLYGDKISMAYSLELRVPILDHDVVRFVESLPIDYRISLGRRKIVHKKMAERYLPSSIINRKKLSFPTPFTAWSRGPLEGHVRELLLDELPRDGLMRREPIERLLADHLSGTRDVSRQIYALFMLASCRRRFAR